MKPLALNIRRIALRLLDRIALLSVHPRTRQGALVVRLDRLGDYVLWLDSARALAAALKDQGHRVTLLANRDWAPLARHESVFDEVWPLNVARFRRSPGYRARLLRELRAAGYAIVVSPRASKEDSLEDAVVVSTGAPRRLGVAGITENQSPEANARSAKRYTAVARVSPHISSERCRNESVVRQLACPEYHSRIPSLPESLLRQSVALPWRSYCVTVPGGGATVRLWGADRFASVVRYLYEQYGLPSAIVGTAAERPIADEIVASAGEKAAISLAGHIDLEQLPVVLSKARLVVANETGPAHLAVAAQTPTICIAGGGHFGRFVPDSSAISDAGLPLLRVVNHELPCYGCNWRCPFISADAQVPPCIAEISIGSVEKAIDELLSETGPSGAASA